MWRLWRWLISCYTRAGWHRGYNMLIVFMPGMRWRSALRILPVGEGVCAIYGLVLG